MKQTFTLIVFLLYFMPAAYSQQFGHLTIFSEDGDKFYLVLNGEKINTVAQTNLRVEELTQPYYNAKIIFEDASKSEISKNYLQITDADEIYSDVTYKIKRDKNNPAKMKLNFFSMTEVQRGYIPPQNVHVTRYGHPAPVSETITQTTTTTSVGGVHAGINMNGVGVNISVSAPGFGGSITETTTVSSSSSMHHDDVVVVEGCVQNRPMTQQNFASALQSVKNQKFDDTQLSTAKQIANTNCMSAVQITEICRTFKFENTRLDFAKAAYSACIDPKNYFKVNDVFTFSSNVDELNAFISGQ